MAFSGTLKPPVRRETISIDALRIANRLLRDLKFNPDRFLKNGHLKDSHLKDECGEPTQAPWQELVANKCRWVHTAQDAGNARARYQEIRRSNEALQPFVTNQSRQLRLQRDRISQQLHDQAILSSRQYAFCLLPESLLRDYLLDKLPDSL